MTNILLIGLGPHARRIHLPILEKDGILYGVSVKAVVDLASHGEIIKRYLDDTGYGKGKELVLLNETMSTTVNGELDNNLVSHLDELIKKYTVNAVLIATEPSCHVAYAKWALRNGLHIFMDKPVSAPSELATSQAAIDQLARDYESLAQLYQQQKRHNPGLVFELMAQRRYHPAFHEIDRLITEVKERTGVPITSFQSTHSDGQWRMPDEIVDQNYHPYNQGYGKLLHSGYHSIDITNWLVTRSYIGGHTPSNIEVFSNFVYPNDFVAQLPLEYYHRLFDNFKRYQRYTDEELAKRYQDYGEIDAHLSTAYKDENGRVLTVGQIAMLHNGFAQRNWPTAEGRDLYKGNGRVRHETHYLVQGPFQALYFQSLQSEEILNDKVSHSGVGGEYHLDIHIFRNNKMFPEWKSYEKIGLKDMAINILEGYSRGHQEDARRSAILTFLKAIGSPATTRYSDLLSHNVTIELTYAAYLSAFMRRQGRNPLVSIKNLPNELQLRPNESKSHAFTRN